MSRNKHDFDHTTGDGQKRMLAEAEGLPSDAYQTRRINTSAPGDYGADPIGDGTFRMVPSGDVVDFAERQRRLS